jgi:hypothetical protein
MVDLVGTSASWEDIQASFPDQWVLLGAPQWHGPRVISAVVLFHGNDKRLVCMEGPNFKSDFATITVVFTGKSPVTSHSGLLRPILGK